MMEGRLEPIVLSADLTTRCSLLYSLLPELVQQVQPLLGLFPDGVNVGGPLRVLGDCGSQKPEGLYRSMMRGSSVGGAPPKVHRHLQRFGLVQLQVVLTPPEDQLFNLPFVRRLITVPDEAEDCYFICKLQEFNRR